MNKQYTKQIINEIFENVFGCKCNLDIEAVREKFAFDIKLPNKVLDGVTGEVTWAESINPTNFITQVNMRKYAEYKGWMRNKKTINSLEDILNYWKKINYTTTERYYESINVSESDTIYNCENVFRCLDCRKCKNIVFSDGCANSEYLVACQRTANSTYSIRVDDSSDCSNCYNVICSSKISNSFFIQDCNNLYECMFCSHISNKEYCIANMQFEKDEYFVIKNEIVNWICNENN